MEKFKITLYFIFVFCLVAGCTYYDWQFFKHCKGTVVKNMWGSLKCIKTFEEQDK